MATTLQLDADGPLTIVVPVERLDPDFFRLSRGVAGEIVQKFVHYRRRLIVLGDVAEHITRSDAFRDWLREVDRGHDFRLATRDGVASAFDAA